MATPVQSILRPFGPVLFYEMVRLTRRSRYFLLRCSYALALLVLLAFMYGNYGFPKGRVGGEQMSKFAESFFQAFMMGQFLAALLLTPIYTAGTIAEDKERKTLELVLATDLSSRELVLSKLTARVANLLFLFLTGLPILAFIQFWGGIDPNLLLVGFATTGLTVVSLAGFSVFNSVYARKARDAVVLTYLAEAAYLGLSLLTDEMFSNRVLIGFPRCEEALEAFAAGNIIVLLSRLGEALQTGKSLDGVIPGLLRNYAFFHLGVTLVCTALAVWRLRRAALSSPSVKLRPPGRAASFRIRWTMGKHPMLWKEICTEPGLSFNWIGRVLIAVIILISFIPALWIFGNYLVEVAREDNIFLRFDAWDRFENWLNHWVRAIGLLVACLTLLGVAVRAAGSVSGERDRQTLDGLLATPMSSGAIVWAKWLGSLWGVRWAAVWLLVIWGLGTLGGALNLYMVPWLFVSWTIYAIFMSFLGLSVFRGQLNHAAGVHLDFG